MTENRLKQLQHLFVRALQMPENERDAWVAEQCGDDKEFLGKLRTLLAKDARSDDPLEAGLGNAVPVATEVVRQVAQQVLRVRCPHCHNAIELLDEVELAEVHCPSCGSSFSMVGEQTQPHYLTEKKIGHFELLNRVGVGQFGSVWKARDTKLDRTVAIKIPRRGPLDDRQTEFFLRDARAAAQLKHPNIVSVHEVGKLDGTIYIASDFVQGATLKEWIDVKRLTSKEAAELCITIAEALHHAHEAGVIHRDLKPGNVMMDKEGRPHIVDFGLAKRDAGEITMTVEGQILGTPAYMPPEQARGEGHQVDRRADIYSLGVILYELLTGELPFRGDKQMLILQILNDDPPSPRKLNARISRDLETICLRCLEKEPAKRYASGAELKGELERFTDGKPIQSRHITRVDRVIRWCRRNPLASCLAGITASLLIAVTVGAVMVAIRETRLRRDTDVQRIRAEKQAYLNNMQLVSQAWNDGNSDAFVERMTEPSDHRGLEWDFWRNQCPDRVFRTDDLVSGVAISPDGKWMAVQGHWTSLRLVDLATGDVMWSRGYNAHNGVDISFSVDSEHLLVHLHSGDLTKHGFSVAVAQDRNPGGRLVAELLNTRTGSVEWSLGFPYEPLAGVKPDRLSADGQTLFGLSNFNDTWTQTDVKSGQTSELRVGWNPLHAEIDHKESRLLVSFERSIALIDPESGGVSWQVEDLDAEISAIAFGENESTVLVGTNTGELITYDMRSGKHHQTRLHSDKIHQIKLSPDRKFQATLGSDGRVVVRRNDGVTVLDVRANANAMAFFPEGDRIAVASGQSVKVWRLGAMMRTPRLGDFVRYHFSSDGNFISVTFRRDDVDDSHYTVDVYECSDMERVLRTRVTDHAFLTDSTGLIGCDGESLRIWDIDTGRMTFEEPIPVKNMLLSPAGNNVLVDGQLLNLDGHKRVKLEGFNPKIGFSDSYRKPVFSPDGSKLFAVLSKEDPEARTSEGACWDTRTGLVIWKTDDWGQPQFSPDSERLFCRGDLLDAANGSVLSSSERMDTVHVLQDGMHYVLNEDSGGGSVRRIESGVEIGRIPWSQRYAKVLNSSPNAEWLLVDYSDNRYSIWDARSFNLVSELQNNFYQTLIEGFSPDGTRVIGSGLNEWTLAESYTGPDADQLVLWDVETGVPSLNLPNVTLPEVSPNGKWIAVVNDQSVQRWTLEKRSDEVALTQLRPDVYLRGLAPDRAFVATTTDDSTQPDKGATEN